MRKEHLDAIEIVIAVEIFDRHNGLRRSLAEIKREATEVLTKVREHGWGKHAIARRETSDVCSFCGYKWGEDADSPHNGGCCDKDAANTPRSDAEGAKA